MTKAMGARLRLREGAILLATYVAWIVAYDAVGRYASTLPARDLTTALDRAIPLVPDFVWAYELCYVFPFLSLLVVRDRHRFATARWSIAIAVAVAFAAYVILPVSFERPPLGESLSERVLAFEYAMDFTPTVNNLPSLHVAISWILGRAMLGQRGRVVDALIVTIVAAITVSTVFVKQHLLYDVAAGSVLAAGTWSLVSAVRAAVWTGSVWSRVLHLRG